MDRCNIYRAGLEPRSRALSALFGSALAPAFLAALLLALPAAAAVVPDNGRAFFSTGGSGGATPATGFYTAASNSFGAAALTVPGAPNQTFVVLKGCSLRNEYLAGYVTTGGELYVLRYDGSAWSNEFHVTVGGTGLNGHRFDLAYEGLTGRAVVVYSSNLSAAGQQLRYRVYDPGAGGWGSAQAFGSALLTGAANSVKLALRPNTNEIGLAVADLNSRLTALIWNGSVWGSEPSAVLTTSVNYLSVAGDFEADDLVYTSLTGDLIVVWVDRAAGAVIARQYQRASNSWLASLNDVGLSVVSPVGAYQLSVAADPGSDSVEVVWSKSGAVGLGAAVWQPDNYSGMHWVVAVEGLVAGGCGTVGQGTVALPLVMPASANSRPFAAFFAPNPNSYGTWYGNGKMTGFPMVAYQESPGTAGQISLAHLYYGSGYQYQVWETVSAAIGWTGSTYKKWIQAVTDPQSPDRTMLLFSDSNNAVWAKQVLMVPYIWGWYCIPEPKFVWSDADGGVPLTSSLATTSAPSFGFDYQPPFINLGDNSGSEATSGATSCAATPSSNTIFDVDHFTLGTTSDSDNVTKVTVNVTAGIGTLYVTSDSATGYTTYGTLSKPVAGNNVITLSTPIPVNTTVKQYRLQVQPGLYTDLPSGVDYTIAPKVVGVIGAKFTSSGSDATSGSLVVDRTPPANPTWANPPFNNVLNQGLQVSMSWTNPPAPWLSTVILRATSGGGVPGSPIEGYTYNAGDSSGTDTMAYVGTGTSSTDQLSVGRYSYRAFAVDSCKNYSSGAISPTPAAPNPTTAVSLTGAPSACGVLTLVASYAGDGNNDDGVSFTANGSPIVCSSLTRDALLATWTCVVTVPLNLSYDCAATFTDADGVSGTNPGTFTVNGSGCGVLSLAAHPVGASPAATAAPGQANVLAGRFQLTAAIQSVYVNQIALANTGTATAADLAAVNVYADTNGNGTLEAGEPLVATAHYSPAASAWIVSGFTQALGTTRYLGTVGAAYGAVPNDTFALRFDPTSISVPFPNSVSGLTPTIRGGVVTISATPKGQPPGDPANGSKKPMVLILNPAAGATMSLGSPGNGVRVQVQVYDPSRTSITSVALSHDGGVTFPDTLTRNTKYDSVVNPDGSPYYAGVFQGDVTSMVAGSFTLQAQAVTTGGGMGYSAPMLISVNPAGVGDGNLLARNNSNEVCIDCHVVQTHSTQATANPRTGLSKYGSWGVSCRDCHTPHKTRNAQLVGESIVPPAYSTYQSARTVRFWDRKTGDSGTSKAVSYVTSSTTLLAGGIFGPCQACHTRTANNGGVARWRKSGNSDAHFSGTQTKSCTTCHLHSNGFAGRESVGGEHCGKCHSGNFNAMQASSSTAANAQPHRTKHTLGPSVLGTNDSSTDSGVAWGGTLASVAVADRSCVNMCHGDHVHNDPAAWPAVTHSRNFYRSPATQATRALTRDTTTASPTFGLATTASTGAGLVWRDFVPAYYDRGCLGCHTSPVDASRPAISGLGYDASAHNVTVAPSGTGWEYVMHDDARGGTPNYDSRFTRNCTKCHASPAEGTNPSWSSTVQGVHYSDNPSLLSGTIAAGQVCFNCHGNGAVGKDLSNKDLATAVGSSYYHPVRSDVTHDTFSEKAVTFNNGAFSGSNRHASCLDCHAPHLAGKTKVDRYATADANRNRIPAGSPLLGATGIQYGPVAGKSYPAFPADGAWPASTAANYGDALVTQPTYEYEICFKCHTAFAYGGSAASDIGFAGPSPYSSNYYTAGTSNQDETDLGMEFSPTMRSGHPVVATLNSYTGNTAPRALEASRLLPPWNVNPGNQTMLCTDCHSSDSVAPAVQGPHGSAYKFMLAGLNTVWPGNFTLHTTETSSGGGLFCRNCHPQMARWPCLTEPATGWGTANGTNWAHATVNCESVHNVYDDYGPVNACVACHVVIPHGSKLDRLIVTKNAPRRYKAIAIDHNGLPQDFQTFTAFSKGSAPFSGQTWTSSCGVDHKTLSASDLGPVGGNTW